MNEKTSGGPAFPTAADNGHLTNQDGMTLRDYFAAKALVGALANSDSGNGAMEPTMMYVASHPQEACDLFATFAYRLADAMLAARSAS